MADESKIVVLAKHFPRAAGRWTIRENGQPVLPVKLEPIAITVKGETRMCEDAALSLQQIRSILRDGNPAPHERAFFRRAASSFSV